MLLHPCFLGDRRITIVHAIPGALSSSPEDKTEIQSLAAERFSDTLSPQRILRSTTFVYFGAT